MVLARFRLLARAFRPGAGPAPLSSCLSARDRPNSRRLKLSWPLTNQPRPARRGPALGGLLRHLEATLVSPGWSDRDTTRIPISSFPPWFPFRSRRLHKHVPIIGLSPFATLSNRLHAVATNSPRSQHAANEALAAFAPAVSSPLQRAPSSLSIAAPPRGLGRPPLATQHPPEPTPPFRT